jgi:hypothetical protein
MELSVEADGDVRTDRKAALWTAVTAAELGTEPGGSRRLAATVRRGIDSPEQPVHAG